MKKQGFTLIELLVSMGIVAVLTGLAVFNFNQSRVRARDVSRKSDLSQLQKALELYKNDSGLYPNTLNQQTDLINSGYTKIIFNDPSSENGWTNYQYVKGVEPFTYYLMACLENTADQTKSDSGVGTYCDEFNNKEETDSTVCACGTSDKGVMYIITQP